MSFSNRIFNVNGIDKEFFVDTLTLAIKQETTDGKVAGYRIHPQKGFILLWSVSSDVESRKGIAFPVKMSANLVADIVWEWLQTGPETEYPHWDEDCDHDGHNELGWRIYCENWGHVDSDWAAICAIKPAYIWYGK